MTFTGRYAIILVYTLLSIMLFEVLSLMVILYTPWLPTGDSTQCLVIMGLCFLGIYILVRGIGEEIYV